MLTSSRYNLYWSDGTIYDGHVPGSWGWKWAEALKAKREQPRIVIVMIGSRSEKRMLAKRNK